MTPIRALPLAALVLSAPSFAQDTPSSPTGSVDLEDRGDELKTQEKKLETRVMFETEWHEFDNLDLRALDESSDQAVLDSDDRSGFAFTGISLELGYKPDPSTRLVIGTSYRGLWGNDQIGSINKFGGFFYFTALYVEYSPQKWSYQPVVKLGRQRFSIGGMGGAREYILADTVDQLRVDFPLGNIGTLITVPINVVGLSADNDDVTFINFIGQSTTQIHGFRGDRMTRRHGAVLKLNPVDGLDARAYGFYTDLGALGSGSDITYNGRLGNFADNDWVANFGVRASYTIADLVTPFASFDASIGADRKELVARDVDTNGFAWSVGAVIDGGDEDLGGHLEVSYFEAQGPAYADDGLQFSHGYVGMKARHVGGLLTNRFLGWHPTAYVGMFGVSDSPHETARKSGTRVITANGHINIPGPVSIGAGWWWLSDTGVAFVDTSALDTITPPFGYSREEFAAEERLGQVLGHEIDLSANVTLTKNLSLYTRGGIFLPGSFYGVEIGRIAGSALGSSDPQPFWDASAGANLRF